MDEPMAPDDLDAPVDTGVVSGPHKGPLDAETIQSRVQSMLQDAANYDDLERAPFRVQATRYYKGEPFGNEEEGRSKVVMTEVRDAVMAVMPSLMRVLTGPERAVEYRPTRADAIPLAEQQTDYANYCFMKDNPGFRILYDAIMDALIRRVGVIKVWWDPTSEVVSNRYTGLTLEELQLLAADDDVTLSDVTTGDDGTYTCSATRVEKDGRLRACAVPPNELLYNRTARSPDDAILLAHRCEKTTSDLVAMGYSVEEITEAKAMVTALQATQDEIQRTGGIGAGLDVAKQDENAPILYTEAYIKLDADGDGVAELHKVCALGDTYTVLRREPVADHPFALFIPIPEPHTIEGLGWSDLTMDLQLIKSAILRGSLDSLNTVLNPQREVVEGQVNMQDIMNREIGAIVRVRQPGMVRELDHRFVGADAFPMVQYLDDVEQQRTGQNRGAQGLEPSALQSTTKSAVAATVSAASQRLELLARLLAEGGLKTLFTKIYKILQANQARERIVRLRGGYVPVSPATWDALCDVDVNVALGGGLPEERIQVLAEVALKQEQILQTLGPNNPLVTIAQYRFTLGKMLELRGFKDANRYFNDVPADFQMPTPPPAPDPALVLAQGQLQIDSQKAIEEATRKRAELELKREEMLRQDHLAHEKLAADLELKKVEMELKYQVDINETKMRQDLEMMRMSTTAAMQNDTAKVVADAARPRRPRRMQFSHERGPDGRIIKTSVDLIDGNSDGVEP